ncbi:lysophospholipid acyltransferase family protein [Psychromarinibacter sp. C21-152]|uniref:Lysophospholipid acyltransferase family protein n=1 Tax=Psychromarinibacter sediminicola TaxID=3033385 RepID=A0AAE3NVL3_9RHOB|nr:lysophospholipid acyltransferase family protein [Psychromarinibacter sediminicola]MDF0602489.1 lysophospholipid acyltransferase family protein [Psychromarinibacter sediminicola]
MKTRDTPTLTDRATDAAARALIAAALRLPYPRRIAAGGWIAAHLAAPVAGWSRRVRENLAYVMPELPAAEVDRLARQVPDNFGRALLEMYSGPDFVARAAATPLDEDALAPLAEAHAQGRPSILVTGHFGSYDAVRVALTARGYPVCGLFNPMKNPLFNAHYETALRSLAEPVFARDRRGMAEMVRHLKRGGSVGMVIDQHMRHGAVLDFLGRPARTALSAAELALKLDALLMPVYGIRRPDGLSFDLRLEPPVAHSDPVTMTQALNDSLAALVRRHPEQWFWIHRRWKEAEDVPEETEETEETDGA